MNYELKNYRRYTLDEINYLHTHLLWLMAIEGIYTIFIISICAYIYCTHFWYFNFLLTKFIRESIAYERVNFEKVAPKCWDMTIVSNLSVVPLMKKLCLLQKIKKILLQRHWHALMGEKVFETFQFLKFITSIWIRVLSNNVCKFKVRVRIMNFYPSVSPTIKI